MADISEKDNREIPVTLELLLETARAIRDVQTAMEAIDVETIDAKTEKVVLRRISRIAVLYRFIPQILDPRRIVALADEAANRPTWYKVNRDHFFCPELSIADLAQINHIAQHSARDYIRRVQISNDCYKNIPKL